MQMLLKEAVKNAIVQSAIGAKIQLGVTNLLSKSWDNPIDKAIEEVIGKVSLQIVKDEYSDKIREAVRKKLEEKAVDEIVGNFFDAMLEKSSKWNK